MKKIKVIIDGREIETELSEDQIDKIVNNAETQSAFAKPNFQDEYCYISGGGRITRDVWIDHKVDRDRYATGNVCKNGDIMRQRALHEKLDRLLWRFNGEAGGCDECWDGARCHYEIYQNTLNGVFCVAAKDRLKPSSVYFPSSQIAQRAIDEVVIPFVKQNPDFVW